MENRYRPRNEDRNIVSRLEKMLPFWERLWSRMTLRRILSSLKRWLLVTVLAAAALVGLFFVVYYATDNAPTPSVEKTTPQPRPGMLPRTEPLKLQG